jgi:flagellar biosynthesis GTPase FlhF
MFNNSTINQQSQSQSGGSGSGSGGSGSGSGGTIMNLDCLDEEAKRYHSSKESLKQNSKIIREAVEKNTKREVEEVQTAIANLNKKMEQIMATDFIKDKQQKIEKSQEQMRISVENAAEAFFKVRKIIQTKENLTMEQKREYEKKLYEKIIDKFMTKEEREMFEKMMSNGNIILMGNRGMGMGGLPMLGL